jgi:autonomous glycyl radical cofactor GrcA
VTLATWIEVSELKAGHHQFAATVSYRSGGETRVVSIIEWGATIDRRELPITISPTGLRVEIEQSGIIEITIKADGEEDVLAGRLYVSLTSEQDKHTPSA